jgi:multiple sugar transport system ATP-binding protein
MATIQIQGVTKRYPDGYEAVKDVDLDIGDGEFVILVGPSGCGKSTLLRMIVGLEDITEGDLLIGGERVNDKAPRARNLAMVFQNYALYPHLSVRENIAFPLRLAKVPDDEVRKRVEEAATVLELTEHLDRKPSQLSGGQRQRVAMGRAIVREPNAFLFDEPLSNLDAKLRVQMRTEIARLQKRYGTTTVYVTHDQTEAMTLGDRVAVLRRGVVQQIDTPQGLYERPVNIFVAGFIGSPAMNMLPATVEDSTLKLPIADVPLDRTVLDRLRGRTRVIAGLRPEHFEDSRLVGESARHGVTFTGNVEVIEWMGAELYAYLPYETGGQFTRELAELNRDLDSEATGSILIARLDAASGVREGQSAEVWLDARKILIFDPESGDNLTRAAEGGGGREDVSPPGTAATGGTTTE